MKKRDSRKRGMKMLAALVLASILCFSPFLYTPQPVGAATLEELKQKQEELERQREENSQKLEQLKKDKEKQLEYKNALEVQIATVQDQIAAYNSQILALDDDIEAKTAQIADKQANIDDRYDKLKERLRAIYMMGEASTLEMLLNAKDMMDLADKLDMIQSITKHDTELINGLKADMESIAAQKASIEESRRQAAEAKTQLDNKRSELAQLQNEADATLEELSKNEEAVQEEQRRLEEEEAAAADAVSQWMKDYYAQLELQKQQQQAAESAGGSGGGGTGGYQGTGSFTWPMPGYTTITSPFGYRYHPITGQWKGHNGIDVSGGGIYGKPIVASDGGTVLFSGFGTNANHYSGYGNLVVIEHGNGFATLYAHASSLAVTTGQKVSKGQTVAFVGSTGASTGPHLHFGVMRNGDWVDPMSLFR